MEQVLLIQHGSVMIQQMLLKFRSLLACVGVEVFVGGLELAELLHVADHWLHRRVGELYGIALGGE